MVSKYLIMLSSNLTTFSNEFEVFLNDLNIVSIDRAIACFKDGINSRSVLPNDFDPHRAQLACYRIHRLTEKGSTAMSNVNLIPKFWINLSGLAHSSNLNIVESCITRVFCMQRALSFHHWLSDIIPAAVNRRSHNTWLDKLASDVRDAILRKKDVTFNSNNYLPNLSFHQIYSLKSTSYQFRYDQTELIISITSSILRLWLGFPSDEFSILQHSIINIIISKSPLSILFLDVIWDMYKSPFTTIFNKWNKRTSKIRMKNSLERFRDQFANHPFAISGSREYRKLEYLLELITQWTEKNSMNSENPGTV